MYGLATFDMASCAPGNIIPTFKIFPTVDCTGPSGVTVNNLAIGTCTPVDIIDYDFVNSIM